MRRRESGSGPMEVTGTTKSGRQDQSRSQVTQTMRTVFKSVGKSNLYTGMTLMPGMIKTVGISSNLYAAKEFAQMT